MHARTPTTQCHPAVPVLSKSRVVTVEGSACEEIDRLYPQTLLYRLKPFYRPDRQADHPAPHALAARCPAPLALAALLIFLSTRRPMRRPIRAAMESMGFPSVGPIWPALTRLLIVHKLPLSLVVITACRQGLVAIDGIRKASGYPWMIISSALRSPWRSGSRSEQHRVWSLGSSRRSYLC